MRIHDSIMSDDLLGHFTGWKALRAKGYTLLDYQEQEGRLESAIAFAAFFWPSVVEDDGIVILTQYYDSQRLAEHKARFGNDRSKIERWVNACSLVDYFRSRQFAGDPILQDEQVLQALGHALEMFWSLRLKTLFPDRAFIVELGDDLEGDEGLAITFYEAPPALSGLP